MGIGQVTGQGPYYFSIKKPMHKLIPKNVHDIGEWSETVNIA